MYQDTADDGSSSDYYDSQPGGRTFMIFSRAPSGYGDAGKGSTTYTTSSTSAGSGGAYTRAGGMGASGSGGAVSSGGRGSGGTVSSGGRGSGGTVLSGGRGSGGAMSSGGGGSNSLYQDYNHSYGYSSHAYAYGDEDSRPVSGYHILVPGRAIVL